MPSALHQTVVRLIEEHPDLLRALLGERLDIPHGELVPLPTDVTDFGPTQLLADVVIGIPGRSGPSAIVVVEVQLQRDSEKRRVWPHYVTGLWRRFGCYVAMVVVALDESVAAWAGRPVRIGPGTVFSPLVVGPSVFPQAPDAARPSPELAVLTALAHRETEHAVDLAIAALDSLTEVAADAATIYADILIASLPEAARRALEEQMAQRPYEFQSDFAKKYFNAGMEHGTRDARRTTLLTILTARGIEIDEATRARVAACEDVDLLEEWIVAAVNARSRAEVFGARD